jgi:hypothetical protein
VGLEDAESASFRVGVQLGQRLAQAQRLVLIEAEALGDDGGPEGQDRGTVDG